MQSYSIPKKQQKNLKQRHKWVAHLKSNMPLYLIPKKQQKNLLQWAESFKMTHNNLYEHIQKYITQKQKAEENKRQIQSPSDRATKRQRRR